MGNYKSKEAKNPYYVVELFCGCGGFSHGFQKTGRFQVVLGNTSEEILKKLMERGIGRGDLDSLIGGLPCQGFSQMRRSYEIEGNEIKKFKGYDRLAQDPRNDLVLRFLEVAQVTANKSR